MRPRDSAASLPAAPIVFFTYIGFDSVSTAAEEARNPQRDLPFGIIASLIVCTLLYVGVSIVLLGMMKYTTFISGDAAQAPVAYALKALGASRWSQSIIVIGALTGMISSLLVFQYGQARIWYAMSRDRLFPKMFSAVHKKFQTPHVSTWIAGFVVGIPSGIFAISDAADLSNIGTLFAFVLVSLGVIILRRTQPDRPRVFKVPLVPWFPLISIVLCGGLDDRTDRDHLGPVCRVARARAVDLHLLQPAPQRVRPEVEIPRGCHPETRVFCAAKIYALLLQNSQILLAKDAAQDDNPNVAGLPWIYFVAASGCFCC